MNIFITTALLLLTSCAPTSREYQAEELGLGPSNPFLDIWLGFSPLTQQNYNHSIVRSFRKQSDCQPDCPKVDIWEYQYKDPDTNTIITSTKPIATQRQYWKLKEKEARIIAISLYGNNPRYLEGFKNLIKSNQVIKQVNGIPQDTPWGYETFIYRIYVARRNPVNPNQAPFKNATSDEFIQKLLDLGCEIAFVDNNKGSIGVDGMFWRFMIAAEKMPPGERIRYLIRDADWIETAAEAVAMGEWINRPEYNFHRYEFFSTCLGPIKGGLWEGTHEGDGFFPDLKTKIENYPYRLFYGDDEMFLRDMIWPQMKYNGMLLTHAYSEPLEAFLGNPFIDACERPTEKFCQELNKKNKHLDILLSDFIPFPHIRISQLSPEEAFKESDIFNMRRNTKRGQDAINALGL